MLRVYRRPGSPYYYFDLSVGGVRKRRSTGATTKAAAEKAAKLAIAEGTTAPSRNGLSLRQALFEHYLPSRRNKASYKNLERAARYLCGDVEGIEGLGGDTPMADLTTSMLTRYRLRRLKQGRSEQTVDHEIKVVSAAYHTVKDEHEVRANLRFPLARPKGKPRFLTEAEEKLLLEDLRPLRPLGGKQQSAYVVAEDAQVLRQRQDNYDLVVMLLDTGCRFGEIARLTWSAVEVDNWAWIHIYRSKVGNEDRLATTARVRSILERRYRAKGTNRYVFSSVDSDGHEVPRTGTHAIRLAMDRIGINSPENVSRFGRRDVRALRDTFATKLRSRGQMSLDRLQKLLGHSSPAMTQKYAHLSVDVASTEAVTILDAM